MKIPKLAIDNHQFTILVFVILVIAGISSYFTMPRTENPEMTVPGGSVFVIYPGASPVDLEQLVAIPIEEKINEINDIKRVETYVGEGLVVINTEFDFNANAKDKFDELTQKFNSVSNELPDGIYSTDLFQWKSSDVAMLQLALTSDSAEYSVLENFGEKLKKELNKIRGIRNIELHGYPGQEIRVSIDMEKMANMNIDVDQISAAILSNNSNIPGGSIKISDKSFSIKTSGSFESIEELKNTVVNSYMGKLIYLKNIAKVYYAYEDHNYYTRKDGKRGIFITVQQKEGLNIFKLMEQIEPVIQQFDNELDKDVKLSYIFNQANEVDDKINGFIINLLQGIVLVGIVILLALGFKSSMIVMTAIPLSILIGLSVLNYTGFGLQQISIAGLVVALGLLVDNAIVMIENINRFHDMGYNGKKASELGASEVGWPLVSSTATTVLAFIPIIAMPDKAGEFIKSLPVVIIATLIASMLIALALVPLITSRTFKKSKNGNKAIEPHHKNFFERHLDKFVSGPYQKILNIALEKRTMVIVISIILFFGTLSLFPLVGVSFFPKAEKPQFLIKINLPKGTNIDRTNEVAFYVESILDTIPDVKFYATNVGHGNPRIYYNEMSKNYDPSFAEVFVQLKEFNREYFDEILASLRSDFNNYPGAKINIKEFEQGVPVSAPIEIFITGTEMDMLKQISDDIETNIEEQKGVINVNNQMSKVRTDIHFKIDKDKASIYGVPVVNIDKAIRIAMAGYTVSKYRNKEGKEYNIVLRLPAKNNNATLGDFDKIYVKSMTGKMVPVTNLGKVEFIKAPSIINRYNLERTGIITADIQKGFTIDAIMEPVLEKLKTYPFPKGYGYHIGGELENRNETFGGMGAALVIAVVSIFAILVLQFRSFRQPLIIFLSFPLGVIGVILALLLSGNSFSFTAFIGFISLSGIVINNAIILIDYTNILRKDGTELFLAVKKAGETRFIPIILTTLTTVGGLLPLTLIGGSMWAPMGWTIIGGLIVSTVLTLVVVPVLYTLLSKEIAAD